MIFSAVLDRKIQLEDMVDLGSPTFHIPDTFRGAMYEVEPSQIADPTSSPMTSTGMSCMRISSVSSTGSLTPWSSTRE